MSGSMNTSEQPTLRSRRVRRWLGHLWREWTIESWRPIAPAFAKPEPLKWNDAQLTAAWIGHATVLINFFGIKILTDPVLFPRIGIRLPGLTIGPKRLIAPALKFDELPRIDIVLLSHAHFDHVNWCLQPVDPVALHARASDRNGKRRRRAIYHARAPPNLPPQLRTIARTGRAFRRCTAHRARAHCPAGNRRDICVADVEVLASSARATNQAAAQSPPYLGACSGNLRMPSLPLAPT